MQVWLGTMDGGGRMLAKAIFAQPRPDVATALGNPYRTSSGFSPRSRVCLPGSKPSDIYAHTPAKGWWCKGVTVNGGGGTGTATAPGTSAVGPGAPVLTIINPPENANVSTKSEYTIEGTVGDPGSIDRIEVWINGERNAQYATQLGTVTPLSNGTWSLTFKPTKFASTHANIYVYAHNRNGQETLATRGLIPSISSPHRGARERRALPSRSVYALRTPVPAAFPLLCWASANPGRSPGPQYARRSVAFRVRSLPACRSHRFRAGSAAGGPALAISPDVVISQVYGGGDNAGPRSPTISSSCSTGVRRPSN